MVTKSKLPPSYKDDLRTFRGLKQRFDSLQKELHKIHEKWLKLGHSRGTHDLPSQDELLGREIEMLAELQKVVEATDEVLQRNILRVR